MSEPSVQPSDSAYGSVHYRFSCSDFPHHEFRVVGFEAEEELNAPYQLRVTLVAANESTDMNELLGHDGNVVVVRQQTDVRNFFGIVFRVTLHDHVESRQTATVEIAPALTSLQYTTNTRIFQDKSALAIVESVLEDSLRPYERTFDSSALERDGYLTRDYCVQYQETNLDFVHRLLEEEGIGYGFSQEGPEKIVLFSDNAHMPRVSTLDRGPVRFDGLLRNVVGAEAEPIIRFTSRHKLLPTKLVVREHDWTSGRPKVEGNTNIGDPVASARDHECYEHGFGHKLTIHEDNELLASLLTALKAAILPQGLPLGLEHVVMDLHGAVFDSFTEKDLAHQLRVRSQLHARDAMTFEGIGLVSDFAPGKTFELVGHPTIGLDGEYAITRITHRSHFDAAQQLPGMPVEGADLEYVNRFECQPKSVAWRPQRKVKKPRIYGVQTARVTGPLGMNVHTDAHGRIKVRFPWDRQDERPDGDYTAWLRVSQSWAGGGGPGFFFIPRIDMEVIVSFLDGDPDRPLVTGCVYNGENSTPGFLPVQATKSILRTRTVPHSDGHNELSFEDAMGMERVHIRAQRNLSELVLHHRKSDVRGESTFRVGKSERHLVGANHVLQVGGNSRVLVGGDLNHTASGNYERTVNGLSIETMGAGGQILVESGSLSTTVENGEWVVDAKAGVCLMQGPDAGITVMPDEAGGQVSIDSRGATIRLSESSIEMAVGSSTIKIGPAYVQINGRIFPAE